MIRTGDDAPERADGRSPSKDCRPGPMRPAGASIVHIRQYYTVLLDKAQDSTDPVVITTVAHAPATAKESEPRQWLPALDNGCRPSQTFTWDPRTQYSYLKRKISPILLWRER